MTKTKLLVVGHLARDVVKTKSGESEFWGGAGYHVAMAAAMYLPAGQVVLKSAAGSDFDKDILSKNGIITDYISISKISRSDLHYLNETGNKREYSASGNICQEIELDDLDQIIEEVGWVHLASSPPEQQLKWLAQIEKYQQKDILISIDTFDTFAQINPDRVKEAFGKCSLGFLNQVEWDSLRAASLNMKLIRKLGGKGAQIYENGKIIQSENCEREVIAIDTTGAGEVVAGVYIAKKIMGTDDVEALREAIKMATKSVEDFGTDHLRD